MTVTYAWRADFESAEVNALHAEAFDHPVFADEDWDWKALVRRHSLGWVCARDGRDLVGFVNVAWDGAVHAFILDTMVVIGARRQGIGAQLVAVAVTEARAAGCEWLHVDFEASPCVLLRWLRIRAHERRLDQAVVRLDVSYPTTFG